MSNLIVDLWLAGTLPIRNALYRADGVSITARIDPGAPGGLTLGEPFSLETAMRADPEYVTSVDITAEHDLGAGGGYLVCGEGSYGSEGFFGRLDAGKGLVWVVYLENSNPFVNISAEPGSAVFTSTSGVVITVNLETPEFGIGR
ncbi:hypothetical protein ACFQO7_33730 [Catellatospora aurea]|uniref:Uncharacterized protein n=1 Tax=Catellatospora aurea TaxID=1337874 RepID=A0ABW2H7X4_9ACTN